MQIDMHYYGTYCLARAAGIKINSAKTIAYAAQYVDDNVAYHIDDHDDGSKIIAVPTAHHVANIKNRDAVDQRYIWVPFHFFPGNIGTTWTERLICRKNSPLVQEMVSNHLSQANKAYGLELLGITTHIYADTFAHWGFSGVSSRRNRIRGDSLVLEQSDDVVKVALGKTFSEWMSKHGGLLKNIRSRISDISEAYSGSLGHGGVSNYPDLPFLKYSFVYEHGGKRAHHDNPACYLECARSLYEMFKAFAASSPEHQDKLSSNWEDIEKQFIWVFEQEGNKWDRADVWRAASQNGTFGMSEEIPEYVADDWNDQATNFGDLDEGAEAIDLDIYRFYCAAGYHLHYTMRELLPAHGLVVI